MRPLILALSFVLPLLTLLVSATPSSAVASSYSESACVTTAEVINAAPAADGKLDLSIRVLTSKQQVAEGMPFDCALPAASEHTISASLAEGVSTVKAGDVIEFTFKSVLIHPSPMPPGHPQPKVISEITWTVTRALPSPDAPPK